MADPLADMLNRVRNDALEEAAKLALNPPFIEARDTEWDIGVNDAKQIIATAIRALKTPVAKEGERP